MLAYSPQSPHLTASHRIASRRVGPGSNENMGASPSVPRRYPVGVTDVDTGDRYDIPFEIFVNPNRDMTFETAKPTFPANGPKLFASAAGTFPFANGFLMVLAP